MLQLISQGYFKGIVCLCWDRISRNKGDDTLIRKLMRKGIDVRFAYANYEKTSSGALHMDIDGMFSQHHSRVTSEKVTINTRNCRDKGICTYKAPMGYLNEGVMEYKPFDPVRAPIIKSIYELYATGDWSLWDLAKYSAEQGLVTVPMRRKRTQEEKLAEEDEEIDIPQVSRPINANHISRILTNQFYLGKIIGNDGRYVPSSSHQALVDEDLFNQVQDMLKKKQVSVHYTEKIDLPFRGVVRCELCERVYTPYKRKGILYFNARCVTGCANELKNFNESFIEDKIGEVISKIHITDDEFAEMDARLGTDIALFEEKRQKNIDHMDRKKKKVREDLTYLRSNKLSLLKTGAYTPEAMAEEETKLEDEINAFINEEHTSELAMSETMKEVTLLSELVKNVSAHYSFAKPHEKEEITKIIFSELYISGNTLSYKYKKGFAAFENRSKALGDPTGNRTPINGLKSRRPNR
jgi:site-specific DNA recombinase